jgi:hypothetical protein
VLYGEWFDHQGTQMRWISGSSGTTPQRCDRVWNHIVQPDEPRLCVDNGDGPPRKRGHGKQHEYICRHCAYRDEGHQLPPIKWDAPPQEGLF